MRLEKSVKVRIESKNECNKKLERQKIDELRGMRLHGQFWKRNRQGKLRRVMKISETWKFEERNRKFVIRCPGTSMKHQHN